MGTPGSPPIGLPAEGPLSVKEAAKFLSASPHTLQEWTYRNRYSTLKYVKIGKQRMFLMKYLIEFVSSLRDGACGGRSDRNGGCGW
ncbi:MAG: helix-turn-helix domain-containing protein [Puniceicoccales bacterium]|nr:helix-turn-helix domain-containing protein [Puniceicoccales bacterium]